MTSTTTLEHLLRRNKLTRPKRNRNYEPLLNRAQQIYVPLANHLSERFTKNKIEIRVKNVSIITFLDLYELVTRNPAAQFHALNAYLFLYRFSSKRKPIPVSIKTRSPPTHRDRAILKAKKTEHYHSTFIC